MTLSAVMAGLVPDAVQREALAERCTADPGPPNSEFVAIPGLQRTVTLRVTLRCARETPLKLAPMGTSPAMTAERVKHCATWC
jgi:hypothetical protein